MARDVLAVPICTVTSESAFSTRGRVFDVFRSFLTLKLVEALSCTQNWLRLSNNPISVEETHDELENFEKGLPFYLFFFMIYFENFKLLGTFSFMPLYLLAELPQMGVGPSQSLATIS